jgi:hypothetical protein
VLADLEIEKVVFANGVNLLMRKDSSEVGKVYVNVRFGRGLNALPADRRARPGRARWRWSQAGSASSARKSSMR